MKMISETWWKEKRDRFYFYFALGVLLMFVFALGGESGKGIAPIVKFGAAKEANFWWVTWFAVPAAVSFLSVINYALKILPRSQSFSQVSELGAGEYSIVAIGFEKKRIILAVKDKEAESIVPVVLDNSEGDIVLQDGGKSVLKVVALPNSRKTTITFPKAQIGAGGAA